MYNIHRESYKINSSDYQTEPVLSPTESSSSLKLRFELESKST